MGTRGQFDSGSSLWILEQGVPLYLCNFPGSNPGRVDYTALQYSILHTAILFVYLQSS